MRRVCAPLLFAFALAAHPLVKAVDSIGLTVSDLDRSVEFYSNMLHFQSLGDRSGRREP
jgi:hypothetical protein